MRTLFTLTASTLALATTANASFIPGSPVVLPFRSSVSVEFLSQSAGAKGALYFLGAEKDDVITYAASSDSSGLGQFLFHNHGTTVGYTVPLPDVFAGDSILHFAYRITNGVSAAPTGQVTRTDGSTSTFFAIGSPVAGVDTFAQKVHIEDIISSSSDMDYNDMVFRVHAAHIPAPGGALLAGLAGLVALPRRRRE